jgi:hypothetical protein
MLAKFARYPLTFGPTPIEKLNRQGVHLGGKVELYAKREDCNSRLAFGGNKLRKLEYIVPDAIASNADTLVSIGGVQSIITIPAWSLRWRPRRRPQIFKPPDGIEIRCTECSARTVSVDSQDLAAADWNRRPTMPMIRAAE